MKNISASLFAAGTLLLIGLTSAQADTVTYDFLALHPVTGDMGAGAMNFTPIGSPTLTASGFYLSGSAQDLYIKNGGVGESGLGLVADPADHEIESTDFVQLDLNNLLLAGFTNFTITLGSLQTGEGGTIDLTNTAGTMTGATFGQTLLGGAVTQSWSFTDTNKRYVDITGAGIAGGDVIIESLTTVPDGGMTVALLGGALIGLVAFRRRFI